ncbi:hypothetical protein ACE3G8_16890 [Vreelandella venusta]
MDLELYYSARLTKKVFEHALLVAQAFAAAPNVLPPETQYQAAFLTV